MVLAVEAAITTQMWRTRLAISTLFFILGAGFGSWVVRIPDVQHRLHLSTGQLGSCLFAVAMGSVVGMPAAELISARVDSARATSMAAFTFAVIVGFPAAVGGVAALVLALFALGFGNGMLGVLMNCQGVRLERSWGKPIMASFHAASSAGGIVGSVSGSLANEIGVKPFIHLTVVAGILFVLALCAGPFLIEGSIVPVSNGFSLPAVMALPLGLLAFCDLFCEGTVADWSAVYLHNSKHVTAMLAGMGYASFAIAMTIGRMAGDALSSRFGPRRLVRVAGGVSFLGVVITLLGRTALPVVSGFAILGLGLSIVFPKAISAAGRQSPERTEPAVAAVSTVGYLGFLIGPPLVGFLAQATNLSFALGTTLLCSVGIMLFSRELPSAEYTG